MRKKVLHQSIKWLLPLLFIFFINGKAFFTHTHFIGDIIVVHSHPFKKSDTTNHNHTSKELVAIEYLTHSYSTDTIIPQIEIDSPYFSLIGNEFTRKDKIFFPDENDNIFLRGPPSISHT